MTATDGRELRVESDLRLVVGDLSASVVADGRQVVVATQDPGALLARAIDSAPLSDRPAATLRELAHRAGRVLDEAGLTAQVTTDRGTLLLVGRDCGSRIGRMLLRTEHARLGSLRALLPAAVGYARASASVRRRVSYAGGGVAIAVLFALGRRHRSDVRS